MSRRGASASKRRVTIPNVYYVSLPAGVSNPVSTPHAAAMATGITTSLDVRIKGTVRTTPATTRSFLEKTNGPYAVQTTFDNRLRLVFRNAAGFQTVNSDINIVVAAAAKSYRATMETDGGTGSLIKFFTATDWDIDADTATWTQFGTTQTVATSPTLVYTSSGTVYLGQNASNANLLDIALIYASVRPVGGNKASEVFSFDATKVATTATRTPTSYTDAQLNLWSLSGTTWDWSTTP